jgi:hypothetical protein
MFIRGLVSMSLYYAKKSIKRVGLVQSGPHHHLIEKCFVKPNTMILLCVASSIRTHH